MNIYNRLTSLCSVYFNDNQISKLEGFEENINLKELYMEENRITKIEGLNSNTK
jgi:Leucine-rich repeat (LRR) protein